MPDLFSFLMAELPPELVTADVQMFCAAAHQYLRQHPCTVVMPEATQLRLTIAGQNCCLPYQTGPAAELPPSGAVELFPTRPRPTFPRPAYEPGVPME